MTLYSSKRCSTRDDVGDASRKCHPTPSVGTRFTNETAGQRLRPNVHRFLCHSPPIVFIQVKAMAVLANCWRRAPREAAAVSRLLELVRPWIEQAAAPPPTPVCRPKARRHRAKAWLRSGRGCRAFRREPTRQRPLHAFADGQDAHCSDSAPQRPAQSTGTAATSQSIGQRAPQRVDPNLTIAHERTASASRPRTRAVLPCAAALARLPEPLDRQVSELAFFEQLPRAAAEQPGINREDARRRFRRLTPTEPPARGYQ